MKRNSLFITLSILAIIFTASIFVFAGTSTPTVSNTTTGSLYTLNDIYNFVKNNTTPGTHNVTTSASPTATTSISVSQLYTTIANLIDPKYIVTGKTYLGVAGDFASTTSSINNFTASSSALFPSSLTQSTYSLEDIWNLIQNSTTDPSIHATTTDNPFSISTHSLADIYSALTTLITPETLAYGKSYLGVQGRATAVDLSNGEVAHYKMNDTDGTTVVDSAGRNNGSGTYTPDTDGKINGALSFNGSSDFINLGNNLNFQYNQPISISLWIKLTNNYQVIIGKNTNLNHDTKGWSFFTSGSVIYLQLNSGTYYGENEIQVYSGASIFDGDFHHIVVTYDGSSLASGVDFWIDNISQKSISNIGVGQDTLTSSILNTDDCIIGGNINGYYLNGAEDDVRIYNKVLSPSEISTLYNEGNGTEVESLFGTVSAPSTPSTPTASAGDTQATVTFTAPSNGGLSISGYTVTSIPSGGTDTNAGTTALTHTITGLTDGQAYTFTVVATNELGDSSASPESNSVTPAVPPTIDITTGLVAHYKMNDTDGTTVIDSSGNGNNGIGTYTATVGNNGGGISLNGTSDSLAINEIVAGTDMTYSYWIKDNSGWCPIMGASGVVVGYIGALLSDRFWIGAGTETEQVWFQNPVTDFTVWNHYVIVKTGTNIELFVNGESQGSQYLSQMPPLNTIGYAQTEYLNAKMDDVRIYNRALLPEEINALWNGGAGTEAGDPVQ